ncbi:MAG TPA: DUF4097 family beta strand repeat-containing protein [Steroidobacteraceae bacterium]|nr:DUF4097 family beta strand repeat-containing protein [Steroidobacteraceae bacterium]
MNIRYAVIATSVLLATPAAQAVQNIDRSLPTGATPSVEISNVQGRVTVTAWDQQVVKVTGTIENDQTEFEFVGDQRHVVIKVRPESGKSHRNHDEAILDIKVPAGASLDINTVSADIDVQGVRGEQRLQAISGGVTTVAYSEQLDIRTISGDAVVNGTGGKGRIDVQSVSGGVTVRGVDGEVEAQSVSGNVELDLGTATRLSLETVSGNLKASLTLASDARLDAESVNGNIDVRFAKPVNGEFEFETFSGNIENCFGPKAERKSKYAPGTELRFTQGSGGARVSVDTLSGTISICDQ